MSHEEERYNLTDLKIQLSEAYSDARRLSADNESSLHCLLADRIGHFQEVKKNVGIDMGLIMLISESKEARNLYCLWKRNEGAYKGIEKRIDAVDSKIFALGDLIKLERGIV